MTTKNQIQTDEEERNNPNTIETAGNRAVIRKYTPEMAQKVITEIANINWDLEYLLDKMAKEILPKFMDSSSKDKKEKEETRKLFDKEATKLLMALGMKTHAPLMTAVNEHFRSYALVMIDEINKEYNCKTPSEKALCDIVTNSYIKILTYTAKFNNCVDVDEYINDDKTKYLAVVSKELDRANRQFLAAFSMLRQIKSPSVEINVKAKTAFVSQNQQINSINNPVKQNENIKPK